MLRSSVSPHSSNPNACSIASACAFSARENAHGILLAQQFFAQEETYQFTNLERDTITILFLPLDESRAGRLRNSVIAICYFIPCPRLTRLATLLIYASLSLCVRC